MIYNLIFKISAYAETCASRTGRRSIAKQSG
jgi:hypothetical protein